VASVSDRIVHAALVDLIAPPFLRRVRDESFACRPGFGTHRAVLRLQRLIRRHRLCMHLDVRSYFPSVVPVRLRVLVRRYVHDRRVMEVIDRVIEAGVAFYRSGGVQRLGQLPPEWPPPGRGLPIGALTSQLFATHVYLDALDHFVKCTLKVPGYVRYVDDLICFGDRRADLRGWRAAIGEWLDGERGLRLKHPNARLISCAGHLDALGYRIRREDIVPLGRTPRRLARRIRQEIARAPAGAVPPSVTRSIEASISIWLAH